MGYLAIRDGPKKGVYTSWHQTEKHNILRQCHPKTYRYFANSEREEALTWAGVEFVTDLSGTPDNSYAGLNPEHVAKDRRTDVIVAARNRVELAKLCDFLEAKHRYSSTGIDAALASWSRCREYTCIQLHGDQILVGDILHYLRLGFPVMSAEEFYTRYPDIKAELDWKN